MIEAASKPLEILRSECKQLRRDFPLAQLPVATLAQMVRFQGIAVSPGIRAVGDVNQLIPDGQHSEQLLKSSPLMHRWAEDDVSHAVLGAEPRQLPAPFLVWSPATINSDDNPAIWGNLWNPDLIARAGGRQIQDVLNDWLLSLAHGDQSGQGFDDGSTQAFVEEEPGRRRTHAAFIASRVSKYWLANSTSPTETPHADAASSKLPSTFVACQRASAV